MAGIPCAACVELNNSLVLDFNVIIVSENDLPVITGPAYRTVMQDQDLTFQNLIVSDPDAEDITMGRSGPVSGAQMLVKVSCDWCTLRVPSVLFDDGKFQVAPNFMEPGCLAVCKGSQLPVATMDEHLLLPKACRTCVVEHGWAAMREGRGELIFFSNLLQAKAFLADMVYRGVYGYNSKWVKESIPRMVACEETPRIKPEPQEDQVVLEISDLSNNGCTKRTWNQPPSILKTWVRVLDVEENVFLSNNKQHALSDIKSHPPLLSRSLSLALSRSLSRARAHTNSLTHPYIHTPHHTFGQLGESSIIASGVRAVDRARAPQHNVDAPQYIRESR
jgi:hypothetical protein